LTVLGRESHSNCVALVSHYYDNFVVCISYAVCKCIPHRSVGLNDNEHSIPGWSDYIKDKHELARNNSSRLLSFCSAHGLSILGSWFERKDIHRHTWISNDGQTRTEIDHILTNDRSLFSTLRVRKEAELPANTDHRLLTATVRLQFQYGHKKKARLAL